MATSTTPTVRRTSRVSSWSNKSVPAIETIGFPSDECCVNEDGGVAVEVAVGLAVEVKGAGGVTVGVGGSVGGSVGGGVGVGVGTGVGVGVGSGVGRGVQSQG